METQTTDKELIAEIISKNAEAFNTFYTRYYRLLYKWSTNLVNSREIAQDATQIFWEQVWTTPHIIKADKAGCAKNFLLHMFSFRLYDYLRKCNAMNKLLSFEPTDYPNCIGEQHAYTHIHEEIITQEMNLMINKLVDRQTVVNQRIFRMKWEQGLSTSEIAQRLALNERSVSNRYQWLMSYIRQHIAQYQQ